jgi:hypothetical protein
MKNLLADWEHSEATLFTQMMQKEKESMIALFQGMP